MGDTFIETKINHMQISAFMSKKNKFLCVLNVSVLQRKEEKVQVTSAQHTWHNTI